MTGLVCIVAPIYFQFTTPLSSLWNLGLMMIGGAIFKFGSFFDETFEPTTLDSTAVMDDESIGKQDSANP